MERTAISVQTAAGRIFARWRSAASLNIGNYLLLSDRRREGLHLFVSLDEAEFMLGERIDTDRLQQFPA